MTTKIIFNKKGQELNRKQIKDQSLIEINLKDFDYKELLLLIQNCQWELEKRGTITQCKTVKFYSKAKTIFIGA